MSKLDLFLKRFDDRGVVGTLDGSQGRRDAPGESLSKYLWDEGGDPQSLPAQRWGVIAPTGPDGDRLLALIEPLIAHRTEGQRAPVKIFRVSPTLDTLDAARWKRRVFDRGGAIDALPRYQLILGDLDQVPMALQQVLQTDSYVGRLAFDTDAGYAAYVAKVIDAETQPSSARRGPAVLYTVHDQTAATQVGFEHLARPCLELLRARLAMGDFEGDAVLDDGQRAPSLDALMRAAAWDRPGVLFTISHGLGAPKAGWPDPARMRRFQGALSVGDDILDGDGLTIKPFANKGLWFSLACYSAGTPARSAYHPWLEDLAKLGEADTVAAALAGLPPPGARPFIAAGPKAALANPNGPMAVIGHVDLAWSYSFSDTDGRALNRPGRFAHVIRAALRGDRLGTAHRNLARFAAQASTELTGMYDQIARGGRVDPIRQAQVWMLRQDISDYVLLGDPAARLPFARTNAQPVAAPVTAPSSTTATALTGAALTALEEAIGGVLSGALSVRRAARQCDVDRDEFEVKLEAYRAAGRAAIGS